MKVTKKQLKEMIQKEAKRQLKEQSSKVDYLQPVHQNLKEFQRAVHELKDTAGDLNALARRGRFDDEDLENFMSDFPEQKEAILSVVKRIKGSVYELDELYGDMIADGYRG